MKKAINDRNSKSPLGLTFKPLLGALLVATTPLLYAAGAEVPNAGSILQQLKPTTPPAPSNNEPGLRVEHDNAAKLPPSAPFLVKSIQITGNTLFDSATLHALVASAEGQTLTLTQLGEQAAVITEYYRSHNYPLARAIVPAQTIHDGVVEIRVIEARYGKITLDNHSEVNDGLLQATLDPVQSGQAVDQELLDHSLLLLSDIPGVTVDATLRPGTEVATSDLLVETGARPAVSGLVSLDNYGNRNTGRARLGATVQYTNPFHHGDILSATVLTSGSGMNYGRLAYETLLNGRGTRVGGSYSALHYSLGGDLSSLDAHGTAQVESLWIKHPFVRRQNSNVYGQIQYDQMQLRDDVDSSAIETHRHLGSLTLGLNGDWRDSLLSGAISTWSVGVSAGRVGFDNDAAQFIDAATAKTEGGFTKWNMSLSRLQNLGQQDALYLTFASQWANGNLDQAQKMTVGGAYTVRAYEMGAISGDSGVLGTIEYRHNLGALLGGQWQAVAFVDSAHVTINKETWVAGKNTATLSGAGVGLNWAGPNEWSARAYVAARVGSTPEQLTNVSSVRGWIEISKRF